MNRCFSNSSARQDWLIYEMEKFGKNVDVLIAVAFFTHSDFIKKLVENGCRVWLIVRLEYPTSDTRLRELLDMPNVYVRYFTGKFHPKLYILGDDVAFVGSSNLTDGGLVSNAELNIAVHSNDPLFDTLKEIFYEYWEEAQVLTKPTLDAYSQIISPIYSVHNNAKRMIDEKIGKVIFPNIQRDMSKKLKSKEFEDLYLKRYQMFLGEFEKLRKIYESLGRRKVSEEELPLRIEIDQFLSWVREKKARRESYMEARVRRGKDLSDFVYVVIDEFLSSDHSYIYTVVMEKYPKIKNNFSSPEKLDLLTQEEIIDTLLVVHAFIERLRYYAGGLETLKETFLQENSLLNIKKAIKYLLFGKESFIKRIADCIFNPDYKLKHFGPSCVQEMYGWVNREEVPICNERTLKSMQWLGFGKL
jgi:HKD family nuclease